MADTKSVVTTLYEIETAHQWLDLFTRFPKSESHSDRPVTVVLSVLEKLDQPTYRHILEMIERTLNTELNQIDVKLQETVRTELEIRAKQRPPALTELNVMAQITRFNKNLKTLQHESRPEIRHIFDEIIDDDPDFDHYGIDDKYLKTWYQLRDRVTQLHDHLKEFKFPFLLNSEVSSGPVVIKRRLWSEVINLGEKPLTVEDVLREVGTRIDYQQVSLFVHRGYQNDMPMIEYEVE